MDRVTPQRLDASAAETPEAQKRSDGSSYSIFDASLDHHFVLDPAGRVRYANQSLLAQWQKSTEEVLGKGLADLGYSPEVIADVSRAMELLLSQRRSLAVRMDYPNGQGLAHALETVLTPVFDRAGAVVEIAGVSRDITERVRRDAALRLRDIRTTALLKLGDQLRTLTTTDQLARAASGLLRETLQVDVDGHLLVDLPALEDRQLVALLYQNDSNQRTWTPDELTFVREVAERTRVAVERHRSEAAVAADLRDTQLLRDLGARLVSEGNDQVLFNEILVAAISITRADVGTIQLLDAAAQELTFGATHGAPPELVAQYERVDAGSHSPCGVALAKGERTFMYFDVLESEDPSGDMRIHFQYGLRSGQSTPLVSRSGRRVGMFSTHWRDRHVMSERETRFLDLLGRQAADLIERTQTEQALRASETRLREADRRKDEFIAMLAHELRNPLVPIRTGVELLKSAREQPALIDTIRPMMERQVSHTVRIIDDLLDVSRITSGKIGLQRQQVTLASVVGSAVEANRGPIAAQNLELTLDLAEPHLVIDVDPTRFAQVLSNLLQNAAKFTAPGGRVTISSRTEDGDVVLSIADSGVGISAAMLPKVFDLFAQASASGHGRNAGLGIGLALARRLVEMHGGAIEAHSDGVGKGSQFVIRLPLHPEEPPGAASVTPLRRDISDLKVVVIDDNHDAANVMAMLIQSFGGVARVAYDGPSGLAAVEEFRPSVVLLDIGMPGMDGYEVCRRLRQKSGSSVGIVALTGWGHDKDKQSATDAGFDAHLTKPADPAKLAQIIGSLGTRLGK
jgi:PAS domain S-box-containing protein